MSGQQINPDDALYVDMYIAKNSQTMTFIRSSYSAILGLAAGTLGLTNWSGFIFYFLGSAFLSLLIFLVKAKGNPSPYFRQPLDVFTEGVLGGMLSYILFWTLLYGIIHVYD
ncbi:ER membrane protein complex subunit 6 [Entomortierella parvispora]|uniref:ER membrane protein complex subunit 6 n=1 Tax=Entomortierella parvispora TaxID=205924 RepID=A0A9P3H9D2_9FUNG|nr:ER membrane protein complex subunit 6 [Entomortierella parvispora]